MAQNRQPRGTPVGGQFATERKPSGADITVDGTDFSPAVIDAFEDIWNGRAEGNSQELFLSDLAYYERLSRDIDRHVVAPSDVVPVTQDYSAQNWIDMRIGATLRALATRGRSDRENQVNVLKRLSRGVQIERLFPVTDVASQTPQRSEP